MSKSISEAIKDSQKKIEDIKIDIQNKGEACLDFEDINKDILKHINNLTFRKFDLRKRKSILVNTQKHFKIAFGWSEKSFLDEYISARIELNIEKSNLEGLKELE